MTSCKYMILCEFGVFAIVGLIQIFVQLFFGFSMDQVGGLDKILGCCFEINLALVIAIVVSAVESKNISMKGRQLKRIEKNTLVLILVNSIVMSLYNIEYWSGLAVVVATFYGNIRRTMEMCKEFL